MKPFRKINNDKSGGVRRRFYSTPLFLRDVFNPAHMGRDISASRRVPMRNSLHRSCVHFLNSPSMTRPQRFLKVTGDLRFLTGGSGPLLSLGQIVCLAVVQVSVFTVRGSVGMLPVRGCRNLRPCTGSEMVCPWSGVEAVTLGFGLARSVPRSDSQVSVMERRASCHPFHVKHCSLHLL